jgi:hypothetical protein
LLVLAQKCKLKIYNKKFYRIDSLIETKNGKVTAKMVLFKSIIFKYELSSFLKALYILRN